MRAFLFAGSLLLSLAAYGNNVNLYKKLTVNGFNVYLINTHEGNKMALTTSVQIGSLHDEPVRHAGRAHLWEHVIHGGSKKFPGHSTLWDELGKMGADYNAYTSDTRIFYWFSMHPDALEEAAELQGAMISEPEWNEKTFEKELSTVKNEALEYQANDFIALGNMINLHTLPQGHPLAMYNTGSQEQLNRMTLDDLKDLYYSNYTPENMEIIVAGNFDPLPDGSVPLNEQRVIFKKIISLLISKKIPPVTTRLANL